MSIKRVGRLRRQYENYDIGKEPRRCSGGCGRKIDWRKLYCGAEACLARVREASNGN